MCLLQCHGSTGHCWCVDIWGHEREGTRSLPGTPATDCDKPGKGVHPGVHPSLKWGCFTHPFSGSCWKAV